MLGSSYIHSISFPGSPTGKEMKDHRLSVILIVLLFSVAAADSSDDCVYTLYVKTGSIIKAGTDSKISVSLSDSQGRSVWISDLQSWGLMSPSHDYYERGNLDIFSGRGRCIASPVCLLNLTSDGSGQHHGWYCDYIEVTSTGPHKACAQTVFYVDRWLATDAPPFQLTAVLDGCFMQDKHAKHGIDGPFVVGNPKISA